MITWMQRHKKWLIVTIWVSTIAFVGAGFVGWGSYNYGKSDSAVAVVGDKEVPLADLQSEYSNLYSQYQNMLGKNFNQELAKQFKLEEMALQRVIQKYLFLNYADDLGLITTDLEVAKELVKIPSFLKDGKFDKNTYVSVLKQNRRTVSEFEEQLKKDLLVAKVQKIYNLPLEKNEITNIGSLLFSQDKVSVKVINDNLIKITPTLDQLKKYWEENKENYKSLQGYDISYSKIENIEGKDIKQMKKTALREYLNLKKEKTQFQNTTTIYDGSDFLPQKELEEIFKAANNEVLKPILKDNNYYVVRLNKKIQPQILPFEDVKSQINKNYIMEQKNKQLEELAQKELKNFNGTDIGYITRASNVEINGLSNEETAQVLQNIFKSSKKENYMNLGTKAVLFKIEDTTMPTFDEKNIEMVKSSIEGAKTNAITSLFLEKLQNKYDVKSYLSE
ncbi:MAG: SurA N-terminal domain-containing protein [Arcobacteraceae bacterium]|nr:SurA N-terminal domain-containing protein [Arcobacteraceae bacterium]